MVKSITLFIVSVYNIYIKTWLSYAEWLEQYFLANDVQAQEKKRAIFLSVCGASTYQLIRNLVSPQKPSEKTFNELLELVQEHHQPTLSVTVQRFPQA